MSDNHSHTVNSFQPQQHPFQPQQQQSNVAAPAFGFRFTHHSEAPNSSSEGSIPISAADPSHLNPFQPQISNTAAPAAVFGSVPFPGAPMASSGASGQPSTAYSFHSDIFQQQSSNTADRPTFSSSIQFDSTNVPVASSSAASNNNGTNASFGQATGFDSATTIGAPTPPPAPVITPAGHTLAGPLHQAPFQQQTDSTLESIMLEKFRMNALMEENHRKELLNLQKAQERAIFEKLEETQNKNIALHADTIKQSRRNQNNAALITRQTQAQANQAIKESQVQADKTVRENQNQADKTVLEVQARAATTLRETQVQADNKTQDYHSRGGKTLQNSQDQTLLLNQQAQLAAERAGHREALHTKRLIQESHQRDQQSLFDLYSVKIKVEGAKRDGRPYNHLINKYTPTPLRLAQRNASATPFQQITSSDGPSHGTSLENAVKQERAKSSQTGSEAGDCGTSANFGFPARTLFQTPAAGVLRTSNPMLPAGQLQRNQSVAGPSFHISQMNINSSPSSTTPNHQGHDAAAVQSGLSVASAASTTVRFSFSPTADGTAVTMAVPEEYPFPQTSPNSPAANGILLSTAVVASPVGGLSHPEAAFATAAASSNASQEEAPSEEDLRHNTYLRRRHEASAASRRMEESAFHGGFQPNQGLDDTNQDDRKPAADPDL